MPLESSITFSPTLPGSNGNPPSDLWSDTQHTIVYGFDSIVAVGNVQTKCPPNSFSPAVGIGQTTDSPNSFSAAAGVARTPDSLKSSSSVRPSVTTTVVDPGKSDNPTASSAFVAPRIMRIAPGRAARLRTRQLWEGTVTEVREGEFTAILSDRSNRDNPDEQAVFTTAEISPEDQALVRPGASFYWTIGSQRTLGGPVMNVSIVQFRRLPTWTTRKLAEAAEHARLMRELFQGNL